jgi:hypothetical protein
MESTPAEKLASLATQLAETSVLYNEERIRLFRSSKALLANVPVADRTKVIETAKDRVISTPAGIPHAISPEQAEKARGVLNDLLEFSKEGLLTAPPIGIHRTRFLQNKPASPAKAAERPTSPGISR